MMDERKAQAGECRGCCDLERSTRRSFLTAMSVVGLDLATDVIPAWADPASERPKQGDVLVAIEGDKPDALEPKDIPRGGPPLLAWPMDPVNKIVRKESRLNKVLLLHLAP